MESSSLAQLTKISILALRIRSGQLSPLACPACSVQDSPFRMSTLCLGLRLRCVFGVVGMHSAHKDEKESDVDNWVCRHLKLSRVCYHREKRHLSETLHAGSLIESKFISCHVLHLIRNV